MDLRSNLASKSRAKLVYEHLMKFTEDPYVKDTQGLSKLDDTKKQELKATEVVNQEMSELRSNEVKAAEPKGVSTWSNYPAEKV